MATSEAFHFYMLHFYIFHKATTTERLEHWNAQFTDRRPCQDHDGIPHRSVEHDLL